MERRGGPTLTDSASFRAAKARQALEGAWNIPSSACNLMLRFVGVLSGLRREAVTQALLRLPAFLGPVKYLKPLESIKKTPATGTVRFCVW